MSLANDLVLGARDQGVLRLILNRPAQRNALSGGLMTALESALAAAADDPEVRVVILAGAGPAFCAGHDLREMTAARGEADGGAASFGALFAQCSRLMQAIVALPKPVIAEVQGVATAAGCQLVASCDLAIASAAARFATPGVNIGLFCSTPLVALTRNVAPKAAMEMLLTGDPIDAGTALAIGLVNRVVPADRLAGETEALARQIAAKSAHTVALGKRVFHAQMGLPLPEAYALASAAMTQNMLSADAAEGIGAFLEKRDPQWQDR